PPPFPTRRSSDLDAAECRGDARQGEHEGDEHAARGHRRRLFAIVNISSAVWIAFEFASYARWLVIIATISSTTFTFDISRKPCVSVPSPFTPGVPTIAVPDAAVGVK